MDQQKVGQFLKVLRNEKTVTQAEFAEVLGVSNRSISRWENGITMPEFDLLGFSKIEPYSTIVSISLGFVVGTLITGLLYASRYIAKVKEARVRLSRKLRK